jgi:hypothetical protein
MLRGNRKGGVPIADAKWILILTTCLVFIAAAVLACSESSCDVLLEDGTRMKIVHMDPTCTSRLSIASMGLVDRITRECYLVLVRTNPLGEERWTILDKPDLGGMLMPIELRPEGDRVLIRCGLLSKGYHDLRSRETIYNGDLRIEIFPPGVATSRAAAPGSGR